MLRVLIGSLSYCEVRLVIGQGYETTLKTVLIVLVVTAKSISTHFALASFYISIIDFFLNSWTSNSHTNIVFLAILALIQT